LGSTERKVKFSEGGGGKSNTLHAFKFLFNANWGKTPIFFAKNAQKKEKYLGKEELLLP